MTGVACARNVLSDRVKVNSLAVLTNEGKAERSKSDHAIVVGGDWADTSTDNTVLETMAAWCGWVIRHSVVATRMWQLTETMERTREHSARGVSKTLWKSVLVCQSGSEHVFNVNSGTAIRVHRSAPISTAQGCGVDQK